VPCPTCDADADRVAAGGLAALRVPPELAASAPPARRDGVRLLVGERSTGAIGHFAFRELPSLLRAGDVLVVNTSRTLPAALDGRLSDGRGRPEPVVVHFSTLRDDGRWVVEVRAPDGRGSTVPRAGGPAGAVVELAGGARLELVEPLAPPVRPAAGAGAPAGGRLWVAAADPGDIPGDMVRHLRRHGRPIRYGYTDRDQPLAAYQTVFSAHSPDRPGSAEMPSAGRPFTAPLVAELVSKGVQVAPIVLHTGVASAEAHEPPYPERYAVPAATARQVNAARSAGGRVVAVGTTAVRALESAAGRRGEVRAARGWTDLVVTPERGARTVDGLLTGLHEPRASHLLMLRAVAGEPLLERVYEQALRGRYLWHEFGDVNLLLP
jgi:S-adenosylmethionine:tRNA ribosyltransferase-isomerase